MKSMKVSDEAGAMELAKTLTEDDNTVEYAKTDDGTYLLTWIKNKKYISWTGDEHNDEVWTKEDGTMIVVQDLELEHAKNIIRMMLRNDREFVQATHSMMAQLGESLSELADVFETTETVEPNRTLH